VTTSLTVAELAESGERPLGTSSWHVVDQERIDRFADATGDHQWIHVDRERAAQGPFGTTVAHGYLLLSLLPIMVRETISLSDVQMGINYGSDRIRFTAPVPAGARVRVHATLRSGERRGEGVLYRTGVEVEVEGQERPAMVGEILSLVYGRNHA
jgi:acyl dehydratase